MTDTADASDLIWSLLDDPSIVAAAEHTKPEVSSSAEGSEAPAGERREPVKPNNEEGSGGAEDVPSPTPDYVWVALHNVPRNWLHEDIVHFIHQVAQHAGIAAPSTAASPLHEASPASTAADEKDDDNRNDTTEGDEDSPSTMSRVTSPFVHRLHIPFGRRTGLVYGSPKLLLSSARLATYLTSELTFDADDFRSRVYFTKLTPAELPAKLQQQQPSSSSSSSSHGEGGPSAASDSFAQVRYTPIEETVEQEKADALRTLELDRYLFAPDLLLDIAKSHQRRLVTKNEKVLLDAFVDGEEDNGDDDEEDNMDAAIENDDLEDEESAAAAGSGASSSLRRRRTSPSAAAASSPARRLRRHRGTAGGGRSRQHAKRPTQVRAGTQKHLGRGSMHNMPIPKPYVQGRKL
ncbi:putative mitochondrial hypothetical protein [Leptomonas pyrrhocoris]|uniref:Uncharacterized protein n=1 Tax=Leptomonas pyrrhocoris TaxID=157538 RepID=A0A0M9FW04_LEPPY|nr:putative mitochondrial hypothetical protein [Leptomonas pyrrhocoris]XP_015655670.1 putative mitochondrial hypothetical protein [Leptomonas pyrrhocoris]KPA77230.1 putative mitochondrial hypothetical protein [Leptomonas pyrrhocoris]KPA77231.1 putative mitochondrial hypothetical protein [Leptomonas pyrrhocoris]|eukprot:XP_015655669.1 putative mitochondrial hypothetical protein [Leptomonas pyrrhocoris]